MADTLSRMFELVLERRATGGSAEGLPCDDVEFLRVCSCEMRSARLSTVMPSPMATALRFTYGCTRWWMMYDTSRMVTDRLACRGIAHQSVVVVCYDSTATDTRGIAQTQAAGWHELDCRNTATSVQPHHAQSPQGATHYL